MIGSLVDYLFAPQQTEEVLRLMTEPRPASSRSPSPRVGTTSTRPPETSTPTHRTSSATWTPGAVPSTAFGLLTEALARRRVPPTSPFTVMSCDNIPGNGDVTRRMLGSFAALKDPDLAAWIAANVSFPDSMVDRIAPVTTDTDRDELAQRYGIEDDWPVVCEPWVQWVLADDFEPSGRGWSRWGCSSSTTWNPTS